MAGANYMGGKRNAAKARTKDANGRIEKKHFGKQRLSLFKKGSGTLQAHKIAGVVGTGVPEIDLAHARKELSSTHMSTPATLKHTEFAKMTIPSTPPARTLFESNSSAGLRNSHPRSRSLKVIKTLDTSEPIFLRAEMNRILNLPNLAGLSTVSKLQQVPIHSTTKHRGLHDRDASGHSRDGSPVSKRQRLDGDFQYRLKSSPGEVSAREPSPTSFSEMESLPSCILPSYSDENWQPPKLLTTNYVNAVQASDSYTGYSSYEYAEDLDSLDDDSSTLICDDSGYAEYAPDTDSGSLALDRSQSPAYYSTAAFDTPADYAPAQPVYSFQYLPHSPAHYSDLSYLGYDSSIHDHRVYGDSPYLSTATRSMIPRSVLDSLSPADSLYAEPQFAANEAYDSNYYEVESPVHDADNYDINPQMTTPPVSFIHADVPRLTSRHVHKTVTSSVYKSPQISSSPRLVDHCTSSSIFALLLPHLSLNEIPLPEYAYRCSDETTHIPLIDAVGGHLFEGADPWRTVTQLLDLDGQHHRTDTSLELLTMNTRRGVGYVTPQARRLSSTNTVPEFVPDNTGGTTMFSFDIHMAGEVEESTNIQFPDNGSDVFVEDIQEIQDTATVNVDEHSMSLLRLPGSCSRMQSDGQDAERVMTPSTPSSSPLVDKFNTNLGQISLSTPRSTRNCRVHDTVKLDDPPFPAPIGDPQRDGINTVDTRLHRSPVDLIEPPTAVCADEDDILVKQVFEGPCLFGDEVAESDEE